MADLELWKKKVAIFRSRFVAREDVFYAKRMVSVKDPTTNQYKDIGRFMIICGNHGNQDLCLIAQRRGTCTECSHKLNKPLTDEVIYQHISGQQDVIPALLRPEGIRYGALDFDRGTVFEDAKQIKDLSVSYGIPCYIARSSEKGYHLYWFFKDFLQVHLFTSYIRYLFEESGFYQRQLVASDQPVPEVFPKQSYSSGKIGNGIKVPMIEPKMKVGKNCWVDDEAEPLPFDKQWEYFENTELIPIEKFEAVLAEKGVEILKAPATKDRNAARKQEGKEGAEVSLKRVPFGNFLSVVEGCPAMKEYWGKDKEGRFVWDTKNPSGKLEHDAYDASLAIAIATTNGAEEVKKRYNDQDTEYQLNYKMEKGYAPMTCKTMQEKRVCIVGKHPKCGDHCLKKLPPVVYENGVRIVNKDNVPPELWPEPSPIRFATDRNLSIEDIIERLESIFTSLKASSKKGEEKEVGAFAYANPQERIHALINQAISMGEEAETKLEAAISANRWMPKKEFQSFVKKIKKEKGAKTAEKMRKNSRSFIMNGEEFIEKDEGYLRMKRDAQGGVVPEKLTNFYVILHEEVCTIRAEDKVDLGDSVKASDREYRGTIHCEGQKFAMEAKFSEWEKSESFFKNLRLQAGTILWFERKNFDHIQNCIFRLSQDQLVARKSIRQIGYHKLKGNSIYLMPSVVIDKDSIRPNDEFIIPKFSDPVSSGLDFSIISQDEFKDLSRHIIDSLFECNNAILTMTTFAHAMSAVVAPMLEEAGKYKKSPVLWLAGSQSGGKTYVAENVQKFYGNFETIQSSSGTSKSRLGNGYNFRHAWMLIDDYIKYVSDPFGKEFPQLIHSAYDRSGRTALQRDGEARAKVDKIRGMVGLTGEDQIENDAGSVARTILIDVPLSENRVAGEKVAARSSEYMGFTPFVVKYVLGLTQDELVAMWDEIFSGFVSEYKEAFPDLKVSRPCENMTLVMLAFKIALDTMVAEGAISDAESERICRIQRKNLSLVLKTMLEQIRVASGARVFIDSLKEMLQNPNKWHIQRWPGYGPGFEAPNGSVPIGFYRDSSPDIVYIYPSVAHGEITQLVRKNNSVVQTRTHVARQLYDLGLMVKDEVSRMEGRYSTQKRGPDKSAVWVWPLHAKALGLEPQVKTSAEAVASKRNLDPLPLEVVQRKKEN